MVNTSTRTAMDYGTYLREARKAAHLSQERLAERITASGHNVTGANISIIERGYDKTISGEPTRPKRDSVIAAAKILNQNVNTALEMAGHSPLDEDRKPRTVPELLEAIERLGIEQIIFDGGTEALAKLNEDDLAAILESIRDAFEVSVHRRTRDKRKKL